MKKIIILLFLVLASCSSEYPETKNTETGNTETGNSENKAWANTSWGMSTEEVEEVVKQELSIIDQNTKTILCYEEQQKYCEGGQIPNYSIGSQNYQVLFTFVSNQLNAVVLKCLDNKFVCYTELGNLLEAKYGKPADVESTSNEVAENSIKTWSLKSGDIILFQSVCSPLSRVLNQCSGATDLTTLRYTPNPQYFQAKTPEFDPQIEQDKI